MRVSTSARTRFAFAAIVAALALSACSGGGGGSSAPATQTIPDINPSSGGTTISSIESSLKPASSIPVQATSSTPVSGEVDTDDAATVAGVVNAAADGAAADGATLLGAHSLAARGVRANSSRARRDVALNSPFDLTYFGGPVLGSAVQHNVFVNCDAPCRAGEHRNPGRLESDLNHDRFTGLLLQYLVSPNVTVVPPFTGRYPKGRGTDVTFTYDTVPAGFKNPVVTEREIFQILVRAITQLNFPAGDKQHIYHVFLDKNVDTCFPGNTQCFSPDNPSTFFFCAYHSAVNIRGLGIVLFTVEPYGGNVRGCAPILPGPNVQLDGSDIVDADAIDVAHETFETITDPVFSGWIQTLQGNEIGDLCAGFENKVNLNGRLYTMQSEYSDIGHVCVSPDLSGPAATPQGG